MDPLLLIVERTTADVEKRMIEDMERQHDTTRLALLTPAFLARLDRLGLVSRKLLAGRLKGERRGRRRGRSVEFADFRNYVPGDDLRFVDWNVFARLDRLFLKLFLEEEDLSLHVIVDVSLSTDFGDPNKALYMRQTAAALAYVGLVSHTRVSVVGVSDTVVADSGAMRGHGAVKRMLAFVDGLTPAGRSDLGSAARRFALRRRGRGICVVLSDFFDKYDLAAALRVWVGGGYDGYAIQVLSPQEIRPAVDGDLRLIDAEDGEEQEVTINRPLLERYEANLSAYREEVRRLVTRYGGQYLFASTATPFDRLILHDLRARGLFG